MDVSYAIRTKRVVRKFADRRLSEEDITSILNAGRRAPSSKNEQTWRFIAIQDRAVLRELSQCGEWAGHLAAAALGVAILTEDPLAKFQTMFDAGQAAAYMQLEAWGRGIGSCPASIYDAERARSILGFPAELHLRVALSFGFPADPAKVSAPPRKGGRLPLDSMIHREKWSGSA